MHLSPAAQDAARKCFGTCQASGVKAGQPHPQTCILCRSFKVAWSNEIEISAISPFELPKTLVSQRLVIESARHKCQISQCYMYEALRESIWSLRGKFARGHSPAIAGIVNTNIGKARANAVLSGVPRTHEQLKQRLSHSTLTNRKRKYLLTFSRSTHTRGHIMAVSVHSTCPGGSSGTLLWRTFVVQEQLELAKQSLLWAPGPLSD